MSIVGLAFALWTQAEDFDRLVVQLGSDSIETRDEAETRLIEHGAKAQKVVESLLRSPDPERRLRAARILKYYDWGLTPQTRSEIDSLLERCRISPLDDRSHADDQLLIDVDLWKRWQDLGPKPIRYLLEMHRATPQGLRRGQVLYLASLAGDRSALDAALTGLESPHPAVREYAARACRRIGDAEAVPRLASLLSEPPVLDPDPRQRRTYCVAEKAAWAIQGIVGFPIDPEQWVERIYPYHTAHHGIFPRLERFRAWWERNQDRHSVDEWRQGAREDARALTEDSRPPKDRLSGCMLLMALGGDDDRLCRIVLELCGRVPKDSEDFHLRWRAIGFFKSRPDPEDGYRGRPWEKIEETLLETLADGRRSSQWPAALGIAWHLSGGMFTDPVFYPSFFGKDFPFDRLRPTLELRLGAKEPVTRYLAALTLGFKGNPRAEGPLIEFLVTAFQEGARERLPWLQEAATWTEAWNCGEPLFERWALAALMRVGSDKSRPILQKWAKGDRSPLVACRALAKLGESSVVPLIRPYLDAPEEKVPEGDFSAWCRAYRCEEDRGIAFICLYHLRHDEALAWLRKKYSTGVEPKFLNSDAVIELIQGNDSLAVEIWLTSRDRYADRVWEKLPTLSPEVLVPALVDHASRGSAEAHRVLARLAPGEGLESKKAEELRSWWERVKTTFSIDPAAFRAAR